MLPLIDGHFWVERNGEIIDWDFQEYTNCRRVWRCSNNDTKRYLPANSTTQMVMIGIFMKCFKDALETCSNEETISKFYTVSAKMNMTAPRYSTCFQNSIIEIHKNGGELKFGSMGWDKLAGGVHYEYGGDDYIGVKDFLK